nr:hypothetical protein [Tanacetum cinerariifolium]
TLMTCHPPIRPTATFTVPCTQMISRQPPPTGSFLLDSRRDVAATSAPSMTVAGGEPPLTAAGPPLTTTGPPANGGWWAGQRSGLGRSGLGLDWVWAGSESGLPRGMPRLSHMCTRVSHVCPHGIHVDADVDIKH